MTLHYKQKYVFAMALIVKGLFVCSVTLVVLVYQSSHHTFSPCPSGTSETVAYREVWMLID
jgi:hypothetical protein